MKYLSILLVVGFFTGICSASANSDIDMSRYKRSHKLYKAYCARCHGKKADGRSRMASFYLNKNLPKPTNLTINLIANRPTEYISAVIKDGGEKHSLSKHMPPFGEELKPSQIDDLVYFIRISAKYGLQVGKATK